MREKVSGIYQIKNLINSKVYIGSATSIVGRWATHKSTLSNKKHHNKHLQNAWNKYGENSFEFSTIEIIKNPKSLLDREQYWIDKTKCFDSSKGYNISPTAGSTLGVNCSEETKMKISKAQKGKAGKPHTEDSKRKISLGNKGKILSESTRQKISASRKGIKLSNDHRKRMSEQRRGRKLNLTEEQRKKRSEARKGEKHPMFGTSHSIETKEKISQLLCGEKNGKASLTDNQVKEIKTMLTENNKSMYEIAEIFGVKYETISSIKTGKSWNCVTVEGFEPSKAYTRLTEDDVVEIKLMLKKKVPYSKISQTFNISKANITSIKKGNTWNHIQIP